MNAIQRAREAEAMLFQLRAFCREREEAAKVKEPENGITIRCPYGVADADAVLQTMKRNMRRMRRGQI